MRTQLILGSLLIGAIAAGCSSSSTSGAGESDDSPDRGGSDAGAASNGSTGGGTAEPGTGGGGDFGSGSGGGTASSDGGSANLPPAGTLTAGAWDDNLNFDFFSSYTQKQSTLLGAPPFTDLERSAAHTLFSTAGTSHPSLDLALVIDTTGSMGDEISYLQSEFDSIATSISTKFPG
ncbi:MAG: VWA domain-containing protein, partial [Polyangiaceae bacterium]